MGGSEKGTDHMVFFPPLSLLEYNPLNTHFLYHVRLARESLNPSGLKYHNQTIPKIILNVLIHHMVFYVNTCEYVKLSEIFCNNVMLIFLCTSLIVIGGRGNR